MINYNDTIRINTNQFSSMSIWKLLDIACDIFSGAQCINWEGNLTEKEADMEYVDTFQQALEFVAVARLLNDKMDIDSHNVEEALKSVSTGEEYRAIDGFYNYPHCDTIYNLIEWYNKLSDKYQNDSTVPDIEYFEPLYPEEDALYCRSLQWTKVDEGQYQHNAEPSAVFIPVAIRDILNGEAEVSHPETLEDIEDFSEIHVACKFNLETVQSYEYEGETHTFSRCYYAYVNKHRDCDSFENRQFTVLDGNRFSILANYPDVSEEDEWSKEARTVEFVVANLEVTNVKMGEHNYTFGSISAVEC